MSADDTLLSELWRRLQLARRAVADERHTGRTQQDVLEARQAVLTALEAYAKALESRRLPVPYALRDELRLHRTLFGGLAGRRSDGRPGGRSGP